MKGIEYIVGDDGERRAAVVDLSIWGEAWEDLQDVLVSLSRLTVKERISWDDLKSEMILPGE